MTDDAELIDDLIDKTMPRIDAIVVRVYEEADRYAEASLAQHGLTAAPLSPDIKRYIIEKAWWPALTDIAVEILRAVGDAAVGGDFVASASALGAIGAGLDDDDVRRMTGFDIGDVRPVIEAMTEAFLELCRERKLIEVEIDRSPVRIRAAVSA